MATVRGHGRRRRGERAIAVAFALGGLSFAAASARLDERAALAAPARGTAAAVAVEAQLLVRGADQAIHDGRYGLAAAYLRGLEVLDAPSPEPDYRLAQVFALAGDYDQAIDAYRRYAAAPGADPDRKARAAAEAVRLADAPPPFVDAAFRLTRADEAARKLFAAGKEAAQQHSDDRAARLLEAALRLDPDLPGPYRLLGAVYGRLGDRAREIDFLTAYLHLRPDGPIADAVRARLAKEGVLGTLSVDASFPCEVLIDGRPTGRRTPIERLSLPAGRYTITLASSEFHLVRNLHVELENGKAVEKTFGFGVLRTRLEPWARVRVDGKDVGLWDEVGVPEGKHTVSFKAHDGSKERTVELSLAAGAREALSW